VYPIALWEATPMSAFVSEAGGPVNILALPQGPSVAELAEVGVARVSYGGLLHRNTMEHFAASLAGISR
jgi:2-methylisocitrate lyase-like PEP mutase family enzyme